MNAKRVQRIWRREGLKVPQKQPKRGRLSLNDGSCIRLRAERPGHVWSYDFVMDRTHDGRAFRMLTVIDEFTRQCLAIHVDRKLNSQSVLECIADLFVVHGPPDHIRSDNGAEFTAIAVREWLGRIGVKTLFIEPGSPWERKLQWQTEGRAFEYGNLLHPQGGEGTDRALAKALQHRPSAQFVGLSTTSTRNHLVTPSCSGVRYAPA